MKGEKEIQDYFIPKRDLYSLILAFIDNDDHQEMTKNSWFSQWNKKQKFGNDFRNLNLIGNESSSEVYISYHIKKKENYLRLKYLKKIAMNIQNWSNEKLKTIKMQCEC